MATYTSHYNLKKPATTDPVLVGDLNDNFDTIDQKIYEAMSSGGSATGMIEASSESTSTATHAYAIGEHFIYNDTLYKATAAIAIGDTITPGTNCEATTAAAELEGKVDKVPGKHLSTEDYTTAEKTKLAGIEAQANKTVIDSTLTQTGQAADAKAAGDAVSELRNTLTHMENGVNENMTAGNAMQLDSSVYAEDQAPYLFRQTGGGVNAGTREIDTIVGGTVAWNQLVQNGNFADTYGWIVQGGTINGASNNELDVSFTDSSFNSNQLITAVSLTNGHKHVSVVEIYSPVVGNTFTLLGGSSAKSTALTPSAVGWHKIYNFFDSTYVYWILRNTSGGAVSNVKLRNTMTFDLTQMFGTAIADRAYALEQATAGSGIAWLKSMGFFTQDYYPYDTGTLKSVEGLQSHDMRDANDTVIASYPLDSDLTLRGIPKLDANNKLYYDGDTYEADGSVTRRYEKRAYQSGDESLADAITDGTNTVVKLATPTTETADPFQNPQICDPSGTEEYVTTGIVPVGHQTKYPEDLRAKIEGLPWNLSMIAPIENGTTASQAYTTGQYFLHNDLFCKALTSIASGATFTLNTNYAVTTVAAELYAAINS